MSFMYCICRSSFDSPSASNSVKPHSPKISEHPLLQIAEYDFALGSKYADSCWRAWLMMSFWSIIGVNFLLVTLILIRDSISLSPKRSLIFSCTSLGSRVKGKMESAYNKIFQPPAWWSLLHTSNKITNAEHDTHDTWSPPRNFRNGIESCSLSSLFYEDFET